MFRSSVRFPMVAMGIWPERPEPGRRSSTTRVAPVVVFRQETPCHEHGRGSEGFHKVVRPPSVLRPSRAALSAARSDKATGKRKNNDMNGIKRR